MNPYPLTQTTASSSYSPRDFCDRALSASAFSGLVQQIRRRFLVAWTGQHRLPLRFLALVMLCTAISCAIPGLANASIQAKWGTVPLDSNGNFTWFNDPVSACEYQHSVYSPLTEFDGATPVTWRQRNCQWPQLIGWSLPGAVWQFCVDDAGYTSPWYSLEFPGVCVPIGEPDVSRAACSYDKGSKSNPEELDPVILMTGALHEQVTDYVDADKRLTIARTHRTRSGSAGGTFPVNVIPYGAGDLWRFNFQWELQLDPIFFSVVGNIGVSAPDGSNYGFTLNTDGSVSPTNSGVNDVSVQYVNPGGAVNYATILSNGGQFIITTSDGTVIQMALFVPYWGTAYVAARPLQITYRGGYGWTFTYGPQGEVQTISDNLGRSISVSWYYSLVYPTTTTYPLAIQTISLPDGTALNYTYESYTGTSGGSSGYARLKSFTRTMGGTTADSATYIYDDPNSPTFLTGVIDNAGIRFNTWQYDATGRVISTTLPGGADSGTISYAFDSANANAIRTVTNALGHQTAYTFHMPFMGEPVLTSVVGNPSSRCLGTTTSISYNSDNRQSSTVDARGNSTTITYGSDGRVQSTTEAYATPSQRMTQYTWNDALGVATQIVKPGVTESLTYDSSGRLQQRQLLDTTSNAIPYSTNGQTRTWTYGYNAAGLLTSIDGPLSGTSDTTAYGYSPTGYPVSVTNAIGQTTQATALDGAGRPLSITDPNGVITSLGYDAHGRIISRQVGTEVTAFTYYPAGMLQRVTRLDGTYVQYTYDAARRLTQISDGGGNQISYTLDAMGNRIDESAYDPVGVLARTHARVFDELARLYQDIGSAGTAAVTTTYAYDANGNQSTISAPLSRITSNGFDELNRLNLVTDPAGGYTQFLYDATDNLTQVTDPRSLVTSYVYGGIGDVKQLISPDTGSTVYTYDSAGNLWTATDARNAISTYTYDLLGRQTVVAYKIGSTTDQTVTYTYDAGTNGKGRLTGASDANHSMTWSYDSLGRVTSRSQTVGSVTKTVGYAFTSGNLTTITTPSGQSIVYAYANGQVTGISINGTTLLSSVLYEPFGPVRGWTWGNNTIEVRSHDADGNPSQISGRESSSYSYDSASRINGISNASNPALSWTYGYDLLDRLTSAVKTGTTQGWTYDANGNRLTQTGTVSGTYTIATTSNRLNSITGTPARTYTYSAAGSTLTYGNTTFTYYNSGRMKTAKVGSSTTTYIYNALGQRIKKSGGSAGTVLTVFDEMGHLLGEYSSSGGLVQETIWLGDIPVATVRPHSGGGVDIFYVHADHLNAPKMITRPSDNKITWRWDTDPFGTTAPNQNPQSLGTFVYNLRYPGQYYDSETGLNYNYFRDYDPQTGKYVESDPIGLKGGINTYSYAYDNPVSWIDPTGESGVIAVPQPIPVPGWVGPAAGIVGAGVGGYVAGSSIYPSIALPLGDVIAQVCGDDPDFCFNRWQTERDRCWRWKKSFGMRWVRACQDRARYRLQLCVANGGKPDSSEPPEWTPFRDFPR